MDETGLSLDRLTASRGKVCVLEDVSLTVEAGEIVAVAGPSGAGKTTLARVIMGFQVPSSGTVKLAGNLLSDGRELLVAPELREIGAVFQDLALWPHLTTTGHLEFMLRAGRVPRSEHTGRIQGIVKRMGLLGLERRYPEQLSGGERQRVALARALVVRPRLLILDEPFVNLDIVVKAHLLSLIRQLLHADQVPTLIITHSADELDALADRVVILEGGRVTQVATPADLRREPRGQFAATLASLLPGKARSDG